MQHDTSGRLRFALLEQLGLFPENQALADVVGVSEKTIRRWRKDREKDPEAFDKLLETFSNPEPQLIALMEELKTTHAALQRANNYTEILRSEVRASVPFLQQDRCKRPRIKPNEGMNPSPTTAFVFLSDCHVGQKVEAHETSGLNIYNMDVFSERLDLFFQKALWSIEEASTAWNIQDLVILLGGDIVEGETIYKGQLHQIDAPLRRQKIIAADRLGDRIGWLASQVNKPTYVKGVRGNHGRCGKPGDHSATWNGDLETYDQISHILSKHSNIDMEFPEGEYAAVTGDDTACGVNLLLCHGQQVHGSLQFPWYGVGRAAVNAMGQWKMLWDLVCMGHHHQPVLWPGSPMCITNGSVVGLNSLSHGKLMRAVPASQTVFGYTRGEGLAFYHAIELEAREENSDEHY